ncbi:MAG: acyl carrier protein [Oscillospiraceae bacterium]|nr:acyl carrier protein [Oscillospiraceae bacterium]
MLEKIQNVLRTHLDNETLEITAATTFEELDLDSLDLVELVMSLEDEFGIGIEVEETLVTVGDLVRLIEGLL